MNLRSSAQFLTLLIVFVLISKPLYAQFGEGENINEALIRLIEPSQLADTVNVWGMQVNPVGIWFPEI